MDNTYWSKHSSGASGEGFHLFNLLLKFGEDIIKKNKELLAENRSLQFEVEKLKKVNFIDDTTGVHNKRYLQLRLKEEFARAKRHSFPISCVFIDLDDFKSVNDTYGHMVGDRLLKEFALILTKFCRSEDIMVRFGGEEFVVIMSNSDDREAVTLAERIRAEVASHRFSNENSEISLSVSLGVSTLHSDDFGYIKDPEELVAIADSAMYMVKKSGKNNTCYLPFRTERVSNIPFDIFERQYEGVSI